MLRRSSPGPTLTSRVALSLGIAALLCACGEGGSAGSDATGYGGSGGQGVGPGASGGAEQGDAFEGSDWTWDGDTASRAPSTDVPGEPGGGADAGAPFGPSSGSGGAAGVGGASASAGASGGPVEPSPPDPGCSSDPCPPPSEPGQLTAGEWRDLDNWDFWTTVLDSQSPDGTPWSHLEDLWGFHLRQRFAIDVEGAGAAVADAEVRLLDAGGAAVWRSRTDVRGRAEAFASVFGEDTGPFTIVVNAGGDTATLEVAEATGETPVVIALDGAPSPTRRLDLAFMVDTTGSMSDELSYLQTELLDVVDRVRTRTATDLDVRLSVSFYRDQGDQYVVRSYPFTTDISVAVDALRQQTAGGGGDTPEAVDRALEVAVEHLDWSEAATARLLFLVLDAPPHSDAPTLARVRHEVESAAARGIRILPVSASGIEKDTEFLLRFFGIATSGTYTFLTDDSGIGGPHLDASPTIGPAPIEPLNDLMVRLITEQVGGLSAAE